MVISHTNHTKRDRYFFMCMRAKDTYAYTVPLLHSTLHLLTAHTTAPLNCSHNCSSSSTIYFSFGFSFVVVACCTDIYVSSLSLRNIGKDSLSLSMLTSYFTVFSSTSNSLYIVHTFVTVQTSIAFFLSKR
jgi:hypothetical protein